MNITIRYSSNPYDYGGSLSPGRIKVKRPNNEADSKEYLVTIEGKGYLNKAVLRLEQHQLDTIVHLAGVVAATDKPAEAHFDELRQS